MSAALDDITWQRLQQFRRRRHTLLKSRGWSAVITAFVTTLLVAVAVDAFFTASPLRWLSSSLIYATTITVWYMACWRPFRRQEPWEAEAIRIEHIQPSLREQLLPAVELSSASQTPHDQSANYDSVVFRRHLQQQVAQSLAQLNVEHLLPWRIIKRWLFLAIAVVAIMVILGLIPRLHLLNRIARALLPAANLDRIDRVAITIEQPWPNSTTIAEGDIVAIIVRLDGPAPEQVLLEQRSGEGTVSALPMQAYKTRSFSADPPATAARLAQGMSAADASAQADEAVSAMPMTSHFSGALSTDQPWIDYRIKADGATTAWHRLTTRPRPHVLEFQKSLIPPVYSQLAPLVVNSDSGHIKAIIGTKVQLSLQLDQPVTVAELRWQSDPNSNSESSSAENVPISNSPSGRKIDLQRNSVTGHYFAEFMLERSDKYRVHLEVTETGFANEFSPTYTIDAVTDLAPVVVWTHSSASVQVVAPEQILSLSAQVHDELPFANFTQLIRINRDGQWQPLQIKLTELPKPTTEASAQDAARETAENFFNGILSAHEASWKCDLLELALKIGDLVETKLVAVDRLGQIGESAIVELLVSAATIVIAPTSGEELRQRVAADLEGFDQAIKPLQQQLKALAKSGGDKDKPKDGKSAESTEAELTEVQRREKLVAAATALAAEVDRQVPELLKIIEQAESQADNNISLLELEQTGAALINLKYKTAVELKDIVEKNRFVVAGSDKKTLDQNQHQTQEIAQRAQPVEHASHLLAERFRTMVSHDVQKRLAEQIARLEQLYSAFGSREEAADVRQNRRELVVLSRQLKELQQSLLDALPGVRQDTKQRLRQTADSLSQHINQIDNQSQGDNPIEQKKQAVQVGKSLAQLKQASALDGGLHDAITDSHRRIDEIAGQPTELLRKAAQAMSATVQQAAVKSLETQTAAAVENLNERRSLIRARKHADREFASDLGNAARAARQVISNESLSNPDKQRELSATATALETLQAAHAVAEASTLLDDVLRGERWALNTTAASVDHPLIYNSFAERAERAAKLLRQAKAPNELADAVDRLRWNDAASKAGQKINARRWENGQPVSAAAELSQLSDELAAVQAKLAPLISDARAQLAEQAPSLSELAHQAASAAHELQQQTESLADEVKRNEVRDETSRLAQLESEQLEVNQPIAELRDALVDHANSQNLLDQKELRAARDADMALGIVDNVQEKLDKSMQLATAPVEKSPRIESLGAAANAQASAAQTLEQLAEHFQQAEQTASDGAETNELAEQLTRLASELGDPADIPEGYSDAEKLASLASTQPEEVLRQLERKLKDSLPMQQEMSRIAREAAEQALNRLERAAAQQQKMQPQLESSDPVVQAQKKLMLQDLQMTRENANQLLGLLVSESKWTAGAAKEESVQKRLEEVESSLRKALTASEQVNMERTVNEIRAAAEQLSQSLVKSQETLQVAYGDLQPAVDKKVHQNEAELANRRREMLDRQRRIAQQDLRNLQQAERQQQQLLRQAENELKQADQREKSLQKSLDNLKSQLAKKPDEENLKRLIAESQRNLAMGQAQKQAAEQTKQQLTQRVESAARIRDASSAQKPTELNAVNPSAQLSGSLARQAAERSAQLATHLAPWAQAPSQPELQAATAQLQNSQRDENTVQQSVADSADDLARAARHESRLNNEKASQELGAQSTQAASMSEQQIADAEQSLDSALDSSQRSDSPTGQADAATTAQAMSTMQTAESAIRNQVASLRAMLAADNQDQSSSSSSSQPASQPSAEANSLLNSQQMAQLLDELDQQLNQAAAQQNVANQGDNPSSNEPGESSPSKPATPSTLAAAAQKISSQMSRDREPQQPSNSDQGQPGQSSKANVDPQAPVAVKVMDVSRIGEDWGKLRQRASQDMLESQREAVSPAYRQQIDAYFRILAERSQSSTSGAK